uniref:PilZ domain-containing protein n=1 Tax=Altererythrobacter segetis TaxID=1104773 RepID=UPI00140BFE94|nr:PilZ domain-containing protein [Altererythrobacter segetis]
MDIELDHARSEPRTNMFVMASISATTASGPVKIRNLSPRGALIESSTLPATGESLELKRGALFAAGEVVWREGNRAGLRFDRSIDVIDWLPSAHCAQQVVDAVVQQAKAAMAGHTTMANEQTADQISIDADQLRRLARALDLLADDLADDATVLTRHAQKLQALDIAAQMLRRLAGVSGRHSS